MGRPILLLCAVLLGTAAGAGAQAPGIEVTLGSGAAGGLVRLGVWTGASERLTVGLEGETDYRSWTRDPTRTQTFTRSGTDWRFAVGPSVRLELARTGRLSLLAYGSAAWGRHRFPSPAPGLRIVDLGDFGVDPGPELALRPGVEAEWAVSERFGVGVIWAARWLSGEDFGPDVAGGDRWTPPALGLDLRFRF